jgi:hypothetical protein
LYFSGSWFHLLLRWHKPFGLYYCINLFRALNKDKEVFYRLFQRLCASFK